MDIAFEESKKAPVATTALLLYTEPSNYHSDCEPVFATLNPIKSIDGVQTMLPGRPVTENDLLSMIKCLSGKSSFTNWVDPSVLATGGGRLVWYTPPQSRSMFFQSSGLTQHSIEGQGVLAIPGLIWLAWGDDLYVYATKSEGRPSNDDQLYQAPFFNVWGRGKVCWGNAAPISVELREAPHAWVSRFFGSTFTHPNFTEPNRLMLGDPIAYWASQLRKPRKKFPVDRLVEVNLKLHDLISSDLLEKLAAIPKPKGEF